MVEPIVHIDGLNQNTVQQFSPIVAKFLEDYSMKPKDVAFDIWLTEELEHHLSEESLSESKSVTTDLIAGVDSFNHDLQTLDSTIANGQTKEAWFAKQIQTAASDAEVDTQALGRHLYQIEQTLLANNNAVMDAINSTAGGTIQIQSIALNDAECPTQWNAFTISALAFQTAKQAEITGLGNTALSIGLKLSLKYVTEEQSNYSDHISKTLTVANDDEIKKTAAAALKVAIERGIFPTLPKKIPNRSIGYISSFGIEQSKILHSLGAGQISSLTAVDLTARNYVAIIAGFSCQKVGASLGAAMFSCIPVVGTAVGGIVGGVVGHIVDSQISKTVKKGIAKIKPVVVSVAKSAWRVVTSSVKAIGNGIKSVGRAIAKFFGF